MQYIEIKFIVLQPFFSKELLESCCMSITLRLLIEKYQKFIEICFNSKYMYTYVIISNKNIPEKSNHGYLN